MRQDKTALENLLLRANSTEKFTEENRTTLNSVFTDFKSIIKRLNDGDPNTFNGIANTSDINDAKNLIIVNTSTSIKKQSYKDYRDRLISSIEWTIDHLTSSSNNQK